MLGMSGQRICTLRDTRDLITSEKVGSENNILWYSPYVSYLPRVNARDLLAAAPKFKTTVL